MRHKKTWDDSFCLIQAYKSTDFLTRTLDYSKLLGVIYRGLDWLDFYEGNLRNLNTHGIDKPR